MTRVCTVAAKFYPFLALKSRVKMLLASLTCFLFTVCSLAQFKIVLLFAQSAMLKVDFHF
jgi:hypothetical protein